MYMKNSPSGTSKQSILHYGQIIQAGEFIEFETANKDVSGLPQDSSRYFGSVLSISGLLNTIQDTKIYEQFLQ